MSDRDMPSARRSSAFAKQRGVFGLGLAAAATVLSAATPHPMTAQQQRQGELHANYQRQTQSKTDSWGAGAQVQLVWGAKRAPVLLGTSFGGDYLKQESNGPTAWNTSADVVLQPGGNGMVTPYAGGSVGANWSTGSGAQWNGARLGLETLGGLQVKVGAAAAKLEERYGYVRGQEHSLGTRLGVQFKL